MLYTLMHKNIPVALIEVDEKRWVEMSAIRPCRIAEEIAAGKPVADKARNG
jgi:hypothetical protein